MGPVTTNPWLIAAINMTIVFGVLAMLGFLMKVIYFVDPTRQKKTEKPVAAPAPAAAPAAVAAPVQDDSEVIAVIAAAVAASEGASSTDGFVVRSIRKADSRKWQNA